MNRKMRLFVLIIFFTCSIAVSNSVYAAEGVWGHGKIDLSKARIVSLNNKSKIQANAADMLKDEIDKRTRIGLEVSSKMPSGDKIVILIGTAKDLAAKSYRPPTGFEVPSKADAYAVWIDTSKRTSATI